MELAKIYEMLNGLDDGADAVASLKKELATLRNEAKANYLLHLKGEISGSTLLLKF